MNINLLVLEENAIDKIKNIFDISSISIPETYKLHILISSPPIYKIKIEGGCKENCKNILNDVINLIKQKTHNIECKLKFEEIQILVDEYFEYKFLSQHDIEKLSVDIKKFIYSTIIFLFLIYFSFLVLLLINIFLPFDVSTYPFISICFVSCIL
jgi:hypothetical protein